MKKIINLYNLIKSVHSKNYHPRLVCLNLTDKCNQRCIYCEVGRDYNLSSKCDLELEDIYWIIDQMAINKVPKLALYGGEPFLNNDLFNIIKYADNINVKLAISSNGILISKLKEIDLELLKIHNIELFLSIDSFKDSILSKTRGIKNLVDPVIASIKRLQSMDIQFALSCVISRYNFQDLFSTVTYANELGIKNISFIPVNYYSNYSDRLPIENKRQLNVDIDNLPVLMDQLKKISKFQKSHLIKTNANILLLWISEFIQSTASSSQSNFFFENVIKKFYCWDIFSVITINYDGSIHACDLSSSKVNFRENKHIGLIKLWRSLHKESEKSFKENHYFSFCNSCCCHFSRNLQASIIKYPIKNRKLLIKFLPEIANYYLYKNV